MKEISIDDKKLTIWYGKTSNAPMFYFHAHDQEGSSIYKSLQKEGFDFSLVCISGIDWNRDLTPWKALSVFKGQDDFGGGADIYLRWMIEKVIPVVESEKPVWRGIVGYSLAGLFALYCSYQTDLFSHVACISGSLWYPGFKDFVYSYPLKRNPDRLYFSIGDKEKKTRNPIMKTVEQDTLKLCSFYQEKGIQTLFELNPGNHFQDVDQRIYKGMLGLLKE